MPFRNTKPDQPQRSFEEIDEIICAHVFPIIVPELCPYYPILPNGKPSLFPSETGPMQNQDPRKYFALSCLNAGLPYPDIGFWLDECVSHFTREHRDGIRRTITRDKESCLRFDNRKPVYYFNGTPTRYLVLR